MALMIKHQIFVNRHLPVQTQQKINISKKYPICSNLLIQCCYYHFSTLCQFASWWFYCLFHMLNGITCIKAEFQSTAPHLIEQVLGILRKLKINYFLKTSLDGYLSQPLILHLNQGHIKAEKLNIFNKNWGRKGALLCFIVEYYK